MSENPIIVQDAQNEQNATPAAIVPVTNSHDVSFTIATGDDSAPVYSSVDTSTFAGKKQLFNMTNHPDHALSEYINKRIKIKDIYVDVNERTNKDTESDNYGVVEKKPRTVIIDDKGETYIAGVSIGIFNSIHEIIRIFGEPSTWSEPLEVEVKQVKVDRGFMLTLEIV